MLVWILRSKVRCVCRCSFGGATVRTERKAAMQRRRRHSPYPLLELSLDLRPRYAAPRSPRCLPPKAACCTPQSRSQKLAKIPPDHPRERGGRAAAPRGLPGLCSRGGRSLACKFYHRQPNIWSLYYYYFIIAFWHLNNGDNNRPLIGAPPHHLLGFHQQLRRRLIVVVVVVKWKAIGMRKKCGCAWAAPTRTTAKRVPLLLSFHCKLHFLQDFFFCCCSSSSSSSSSPFASVRRSGQEDGEQRLSSVILNCHCSGALTGLRKRRNWHSGDCAQWPWKRAQNALRAAS